VNRGTSEGREKRNGSREKEDHARGGERDRETEEAPLRNEDHENVRGELAEVRKGKYR